MNDHITRIVLYSFICFIIVEGTGCTLKASTESVTDASTNFLSSTTPSSWFTVEGLLHPHQRLNAFIATNLENLQQDIARGNREYLTSLGSLYGISDQRMSTISISCTATPESGIRD